MKNTFYFFLFIFLAGYTTGRAQIISTIAGNDTMGYNGDNIPATNARLNSPTFLAVDTTGNVYISDFDNYRVRKVSTLGIITTIAGTGVGGYSGEGLQATDAQIGNIDGVVLDKYGNLFLADDGGNRIWKINTAGVMTTIAGSGTYAFSGDNGPGTAAEIAGPHGIAVDTMGNVYFADFGNNRVRKISTTGIITTVAGSGTSVGDLGPATAAMVKEPYGVAVDKAGNLYIAEWTGNRIRKVDAVGIITTLAGNGMPGYTGDNGPATAAKIKGPAGIAISDYGELYLTDPNDNVVRKISRNGYISTIAGTGVFGHSGDGGIAINAEMKGPLGVFTDKVGNVFITEFANHTVRKIQTTVFVDDHHISETVMELYPNPSGGQFYVEIKGTESMPVVVYLISMTGEKVHELTATTNKIFEMKTELPTGCYNLIAKTPYGLLCKKIELIH